MTSPKTSRIADITIPIPDYRRPEIVDDPNGKRVRTFPYFVGRRSVIEKLKDRLKSSPKKGGAYLFVGARGMGKTTVINKTIQELNQPDEKFIPVEISLSNENFEEIDIYRIIAKKFINEFLGRTAPPKRISHWNDIVAMAKWVLVFLSVVYFLNFGFIQFALGKGSLATWLYNVLLLISAFLGIYIVYRLICFVQPMIKNWYESDSYSDDLTEAVNMARSLQQRIDMDVTVADKSGLVSKALPFELTKQKTTKYPIADIRFIEHELIKLIKKAHQVNASQYEYVFVFDELDKIEFQNNSISEERDYESSEEENLTRRQQKAIIDILGNFKYFLNNAPAKFIFIAGREMTDAAMADISKRDFYLRSIFDDIIHIDSLLKEDIKKIDLRITSAIELYVYGILCGNKKFQHGESEELEDIKGVGGASTLDEKLFNSNWEEEKQNRYKAFLRDFILYLTFRSHGSPRLLYQYFEKYVKPNEGKSGYELKFDFNQQSIIGLVAQMYRGLVRQHYNTTIGNSDKLLSNLPFIFDHVLKFHDFAFSWRSLELVPEVIDVNKSPNLRKHIRTVVDYLENSYVRRISNGLFEYKFSKTTANEIRYASEISKTSRAAFNFTLDESLPLKSYYQKQISKLKSDISQERFNQSYSHSIGFYYIILGDLHFYDKEYDKAIENYNNAVQPFRQKSLNAKDKSKRIRSHEFIIYVRGMLKITLTFERMKLYDSVFTYLEWNNRNVINYFNLPKRKKHLEKLLNTEDFKSSSVFQFNNQLVFIDGFLNVLYITEKASKQGVTERDVKRSEQRFDQITKEAVSDVKPDFDWYFSMLRAHFLNKLGHLLFYKNGFLPGRKIHHKRGWVKTKSGDYAREFYEYIVGEFEINGGDIDKPLPEYYNIPISAYDKYYRCLSELLIDSRVAFGIPPYDAGFVERECYLIGRYAQFLYSDQLLFPHNYQSKLFNEVGNYISDFANTVLCFSEGEVKSNEWICKTIKLINQSGVVESGKSGILHIVNDEKYSKIVTFKECRFTLFTYLASLYYKRINNQHQHAYALTRILFLIKYNCALSKQSLSLEDIESVFKQIAIPALKATFLSCEYHSYKAFIDVESWSDFKTIISDKDALRKVVANPQVKKILIALFEIVIFSYGKEGETPHELDDSIDILLRQDWVNENMVMNDSFSRTMELRYKVNLNHVRLARCEGSDKTATIADSIWCLRKIKTNLSLYGLSYITNYYFRAEASLSIARLLVNARGLAKDGNGIDGVMEHLQKYEISMDTARSEAFKDSRYHYREAMKSLRSCIQLHSQGTCYYKTIKPMYYLEGDFDDEVSHFCATMDRYRINTGIIGELIAECEKGLNSN